MTNKYFIPEYNPYRPKDALPPPARREVVPPRFPWCALATHLPEHLHYIVRERGGLVYDASGQVLKAEQQRSTP